MKLIQWHDDLSVGNEHLDNQRKDVICLINMVLRHHSGLASVGHELSSLLERLRIVVARHFIEEEILLEQNDCPSLEEHAVDHAYMVLKLSETGGMPEEEIIHERIPLLCGMLEKHFASQDVECRAYLSI